MDRLPEKLERRLDIYLRRCSNPEEPRERAALRSAGLHGFILAAAYQKTLMHQVASILIWRWPEVVKITELIEPPSMHEIPINRSSKLRPLPL
jgi:hypothetical protein